MNRVKQTTFLLLCFFVYNFNDVEAQNSCNTPNGESARCIPINDCSILYNAVLTTDPEVVRFLRASQCGYSGGPLVCCGSTASFAPPVTSPTILTRRPDLLPPSNECGIQAEKDKILNGENTIPEEFPWAALIGYKNSSGFQQFSCGATLISNRYVLTAAHCVTGRILRAVGALEKVRLGEWNTETNPDCYGGNFKVCIDEPIDLRIEQAIPHKDYVDGATNRYHDIALIRLNREVKFTNYIRPVCIPQPSDEVRVGQNLTVVGWGKTETGKYSAVKQKLAVPVVQASNCNSVFNRAGVTVRTTQLCAGGERDKDSCNGDSGGPLLGQRGEQFFLEGVVSFGAACGSEGWPGIYTKVAQYRNWIEGNIRP